AVLSEFAPVVARSEPAEVSDDGGEGADRNHPVDRGRQLIHRGCGPGMPRHSDTEHEGIAEPERQPGEETDFGDVDGVQTVVRIDPETDGAAGKYGGADVVADRIAGKTRQRGDAVGHLLFAD